MSSSAKPYIIPFSIFKLNILTKHSFILFKFKENFIKTQKIVALQVIDFFID